MVHMDLDLMAKFAGTVTSPVSDSQWHGDDVSTMKEEHITRIMFHNVNGLTTRGIEGFEMFAHEQAQLQIDIQCFSEHCLDTTKYQVYHTTQATIHRHFPGQSSLQLASSSEPAVNVYKPGGTGILVLGELVSRQEPQGKGGDPMGRWSYLHLRRYNLPPLTIISAYQVCARPTNLIGNTAYHQQIRALHALGHQNTHPRQAFMQALGIFIEALQSKGHDIILGGDFNESLDDKKSGLLQLITKYNLVDPFLHKFPHHPTFGTHTMGHRRIDSIFISPRVMLSLQKIGYAPFQFSKPSDHRPVIIELDTQTLFGQKPSPLKHHASRAVKSKDKTAVSCFIDTWYKEVASQLDQSLLQQVNDDSASPATVEMIDRILGQCGDIAEKACKKRRPEFYSRQIVQQRLRVSLLRGHLNSLRAGKDRSEQLIRRMRRGGLDFPLPPTHRQTTTALQAARDELITTCRNHAEVRQKELLEKIDAAVASGNKTRAQILRTIKKTEDSQRTYKVLRAMKQRKNETCSLDRLEIPLSWPQPDQPLPPLNQLEDPKDAIEWRMITDPYEIEYYLLLRNRLHFGQAQGTPFTCEPLTQDLDWLASTPAADQLLAGTYTTQHDIPNCEDLLQACKAVTQLDSLPDEITVKEFQGKIKAWRENTTTSPSGRHLGRYKALFASGIPDSDGETEGETVPLVSKQETLTAIIVSIVNYCIRNNYVLSRWKKIINVMIFKELNNFKIHRLRVIHIYEADFNLLLALKWRQLLRSADGQNVINEGQYGGRPGCEAQSLTLLEELKYDLAYLTRRTLFNFDNDATSCYDRIIVPLASIINRKYGLHRKVVALHAKTLQQAQFFLKTAAGISSENYSHCPQFPIHGTGQGSGNSPSIWLFLSSTLFDLHSSLSHGAKFVSPDGTHSVTFSMVGFVDDSTGSCNDFQPQNEAPMQDLLRLMERDAQLWNNLLFCSGGKLELPKCSFHVLRFQFKPNGTPIPVLDNYDNQIQLEDLTTKVRVPIHSKRPFDSHKTLGHFKSPTSRMKTELDNIRDKANRLSLLIGASPLTRYGASVAYATVYLPSIQYTLPQSFFTRKELDNAQSSSMMRVASKCGYNRYTSRALLYAPKSHAGGGFLPWHLLQGEGQTRHFLKHWRTDTLVSRTLRVTLSWAQWQAGHDKSILSDPDTPLTYLECRWLSSLRDFLSHIKARIHVVEDAVAPRERKNDVYIMKYARECGLFDDKALKIINYCRLYLHVTTVSELFQSDGRTMIPEIFECHREPWFNPDTYISLQRRPSGYQIKMKWQRLLRQWTTSDGTLAASWDLGPWALAGHQLRRQRATYCPHEDHKVRYHWKGDCYWEYQQDELDTTHYLPIRPTEWRPVVRCIPTQGHLDADGTLIDRSYRRFASFQPAATISPLSYQSFIQTLQPWEQDLLGGITLRQQPYEIVHYLGKMTASEEVIAVSDGSHCGTRLTYGWIVGTTTGTILATHSGEGSGNPTSHRAEAWGMLSASLFIYSVIRYTRYSLQHHGDPLPLRLYSDNSGLVERVTQRLTYSVPYPNATLAPDWDLIEQIIQTIRLLSLFQTKVQWVRGHQDDIGVDDLPIEAQFNIRADALAGSHSSDGLTTQQVRIIVPAERCTLEIDRVLLHGHYTAAIRQAYTLPPLYQYLEDRYHWTSAQRQQVDWEAFQRAANNVSTSPTQLLKLVYGKLPTNSELSKANAFHSPRCHYCDERETFAHLCRCANPISDRFRRDILAAITQYMMNQNAPDIFQQMFTQSLKQALDILDSTSPNPRSATTTCCLDTQALLGERTILQGFLTQQWQQLYRQSYSKYSVDLPTNGMEFVAGLIKVVWQEQLRLWSSHLEHIKGSNQQSLAPQVDKLHHYRTRIRSLHEKRHLCLHGHRDMYFHPDVEEYLRMATGTQLRMYLHHYEPAIQASIQAAAEHQTRALFTFPGFSRLRTSLPHPRASPPSQLSNVSTENDGAPNHRKHTRWRPSIPLLPSIRNFFSAKPD